MSKPLFLVCPPTFFGVDYVINPWMEGKIGSVNRDAAISQWEAFVKILVTKLGAEILMIEPQPGMPDLVFTANAGAIREGTVIPANFRFAERIVEEPVYRAWFQESGLNIAEIEAKFEGAGDALYWRPKGTDQEGVLFVASGLRSDPNASGQVSKVFGCEVVGLSLVNPSFYHLDTCFCPLPNGELLWFRAAFDAESQAKIEAIIPEDVRFELRAEDAQAFAANAVATKTGVVLNTASPELRTWLEGRGYQVFETSTSEFLKAGGSTKCLSLRLNESL